MHYPVPAIIITLYMVALLFFGLRFSRRQKTTEAYFVAGRAIPGWVTGISLVATIITSVTFIAYPGAAYAGDWHLLVPGFMFVLVLAAIGMVVVPFYRRVVTMSAYEYFGKRFGRGVRAYSSLAFAAGHFSKMGFVIYLLALTVSQVTGWRVSTMVIALGAVTIVYTLIGGLEAVMWSDVLQGFLLAVGVFVAVGYLLFSPQSQPVAMLHMIAAHHKTSLGSFKLNLHEPTFWVLAIYGVSFYLQKYTADQTVVQRYLAARTDREALLGTGLGALLCVPVWAAFMFIGSLLWAFYHLPGNHAPTGMSTPDQIFPHFLMTQMPPAASGVFLAALFGAAMSMLASDLNCLAVILVEDHYRMFFPGSTDKQRLRMGRIMVVCCGVLAIGVSLLLRNARGGALGVYYAVTAVVAGGLAGLFLLAFLMRRAGRKAALSAIGVSLAFTIYATLTLDNGKLLNLHGWNYPWHADTVGAVGSVLLLVVGGVFTMIFPEPQGAGPSLTLWQWLEDRRATTLKAEVSVSGGRR